MNPISHNLLMAAVAGSLLGAAGHAYASESSGGAVMPVRTSAKDGADKADKHACKGQNSCKAQGGCKTDKHACKAQNACKGQGGCKGA